MLEASMPMLRDGLAVIAAAVAVVFDERSRRIPNPLTYGTALVALVLLALHCALQASQWRALAFSSLGGGFFLLVVFGLLTGLGMLGMGDTKLLFAIGLSVGLTLALRVALCVLLAGGVLALVHALRQRRLRAVVSNVGSAERLRGADVTKPQQHLHLFGYAQAIALGTAWAVLGRYHPGLLPL